MIGALNGIMGFEKALSMSRRTILHRQESFNPLCVYLTGDFAFSADVLSVIDMAFLNICGSLLEICLLNYFLS